MGEAKCRLCLKESELRHSHVLPEFFYTGIYESRDAHRALAITDESVKIIQKGLREDLLCQDCETQFSRHEKYVAELIRDIPSFTRDASGRFLYSEHVDYSSVKLFQLSLIWRCSIARNPAFTQVCLGPHEEIIRCRLLEQNPGKSFEYGCVMMAMLETEILHKVMTSPTLIKPRPFGHKAYKLRTGNLTWVFFVDSHLIEKNVQELFAQENGLLRIWLAKDEQKAILCKEWSLRDQSIERNLY